MLSLIFAKIDCNGNGRVVMNAVETNLQIFINAPFLLKTLCFDINVHDNLVVKHLLHDLEVVNLSPTVVRAPD